MPVWRIYHPSNTFTTKAEKEALSKDITAIYTLIPLPAFYVVVLFIPLPEENTFIGGEVRVCRHFVKVCRELYLYLTHSAAE